MEIQWPIFDLLQLGEKKSGVTSTDYSNIFGDLDKFAALETETRLRLKVLCMF